VSEDVELVVYGSELGRAVWRGGQHEVVRVVPTGTPIADATEGVDAALCILDIDVANDLLAAGIPTVYVDSLPFPWRPADGVPLHATKYLAQLTPDLPATCWDVLSEIECLEWIEGIVPADGTWSPTSDRIV